ncbi:MAG TPA: DUF2079 domain-containing protein [Chthonomonas sp.]|uniref:DUF2079 domain-containing protein n=1 Tax=Chthonomonas sp. TaxID=2282153 RepID=UPI002B4AF2BE|nr:DUF2079 domain-containing protein [Chthonomonas sp.]HLH78887.1 DUF2079 domain-containing protein [Chthonomonas sp.]
MEHSTSSASTAAAATDKTKPIDVGIWIAGLGIGAFVLVYGTLAVVRVMRLEAAAFDLGIFDQTLWKLSRFEAPYCTVRGMNLFGDHFTPILFLLIPLYWFFPEPHTLVFLQAVALAVGAWPLYRLARFHGVGSWLSAALVLTYLLAPALGAPALFDFHPNMLAVPCLLFAIDAMERENYRSLALWVALSLFCRQDLALSIMAFGMVSLLRTPALKCSVSESIAEVVRRRWKRGIAGISLLAAGGIWLIASLSIMNRLSGHTTGYTALYSAWGNTPLQIVTHIILHPGRVMSFVFSRPTGLFVLQIVLPTAGLCLGAPEILLGALPELLADVLSDRAVMRTIMAEYTPAIMPFVYAAAAIGLARLAKLLQRWGIFSIGEELLVSAVLVFLGGYCFWSYGSWDTFGKIWSGFLTNKEIQERKALLATIPQSASVSATADLVVPLAHRNIIYMFPNPFLRAWYGPGWEAILEENRNEHPPLPHDLYALLKAHSAGVQYIVAADAGPYQPLIMSALQTGFYRRAASAAGMIILVRQKAP